MECPATSAAPTTVAATTIAPAPVTTANPCQGECKANYEYSCSRNITIVYYTFHNEKSMTGRYLIR